MGEGEKAVIICCVTVCFFLALIACVGRWAEYETAKLDYICTQE